MIWLGNIFSHSQMIRTYFLFMVRTDPAVQGNQNKFEFHVFIVIAKDP